jgi:hypothetical protein
VRQLNEVLQIGLCAGEDFEVLDVESDGSIRISASPKVTIDSVSRDCVVIVQEAEDSAVRPIRITPKNILTEPNEPLYGETLVSVSGAALSALRLGIRQLNVRTARLKYDRISINVLETGARVLNSGKVRTAHKIRVFWNPKVDKARRVGKVAEIISLLSELLVKAKALEDSDQAQSVYTLNDFLRHCFAAEREAGAYRPSASYGVNSTGATAWRSMLADEPNLQNSSDQTLAGIAIEAVEKAISSKKDRSSYEASILKIINDGFVSESTVNIAGSIVAFYRGIDSRRIETSASSSSYVGQVGERMELSLILISSRNVNTQYGSTIVVTSLRDSDGNVFTIFGEPVNLRSGEFVTISATVKKHETFQGIKRTTLVNVIAT